MTRHPRSLRRTLAMAPLAVGLGLPLLAVAPKPALAAGVTSTRSWTRPGFPGIVYRPNFPVNRAQIVDMLSDFASTAAAWSDWTGPELYTWRY